MNLPEKHRPKTWAELVGQPEAQRIIDRLRPNGLTGRAYWISGPSGTGKTTIARLLAAEVSHPIVTEEIDFRQFDADFFRLVDRQRRGRPMFGGAYAYIVNEAHRLRQDVVTGLLTLLDPVPEIELWAFTTTTEAQKTLFDRKLDAAPFLSRCVPLETHTDTEAFAQRARQIAESAGLNGCPIAEYRALVEAHNGNLRGVLQAIEAGTMHSGLTVSAAASNGTARKLDWRAAGWK